MSAILRCVLLLPLLTVLGAADAPERQRALFAFDPGDDYWTDTGPATLERERKVLRLPASEAEYSVTLAPRTKPAFHRGRRLVIRAELLGGTTVGLAAVLRDAKGMEFATGNLPLEPGETAVGWTIPERVEHRWGKRGDGRIHDPVELLRLMVVRWPSATPAELRIDGVDVVERFTPADAARVAFAPTDPVAVVAPGSTDARFVLTTGAEQAAELDWRLEITTAAGEALVDQRRVRVVPGESTAIPLPAAATRDHGLLRMDWTLADAHGERRGSQRLAVMDLAGHDPSHRDHFLFGCGGGATEALRQIGVDVLRCSDDFTHQSKPGGVYDWDQERREAEHLAARGFEISWLTSYTPRWGAIEGSREGHWSGTRPIRLDVWRAYIKDMVATLGDHVRYYEIWNEADLDGFYTGDYDHYRELLRIAHEEIKAVDPELQVLTCGWAVAIGHGGRNLNPDIQRRVIAECQDWFDYHAFHQHGDFYRVFQPAVDGELADIRAALRSPKPLFYTETSVCSGADWGSQVWQGEELIKKVVFAWARGAYAYEWFVPVDHDEQWGLLLHDHQPKPAYCAYNTLIRVLRGLAPAGQLEGLGRDRWGFAFADPDGADPRRVYVVWRENPTLPEADFLLEVGAQASASVIDMWGDAQTLAVIDGQVRLQPRKQPQFVVVTDAADTSLAVQPLALPAAVGGIAPGERHELTLQAGNPGTAPRELTMELELPAELDVAAPQPERRVLDAGSAQALAIPIGIPDDVALPRSGLLQARLRYALDGAWSGELALPMETVRLIPADGMDARDPDLVLSGDGSVVSYFAADPANADKLWRGPDDLSARVWLAADDTHLHLRVAVRDDVHQEQHVGHEAWRGDSLQVALQAEGMDGWWEVGIYQPQDEPYDHIYRSPKGLPNAWKQVRLSTSGGHGELVYDAAFPLAAYGLDRAALEHGIRFNLVVNDSDVGVRESCLRLAPGIAESKTMTQAPLLRFRFDPN